MAFAISTFSFSCNKEQKQEQPTTNVQQEQFVDKEKQLKDKEELLRIKEENLNAREQAIFKKEQELGLRPDSTGTTADTKDSTKIKEKEKKEKKIEKELNKRLGNPTETVSTYIEYLQRAITDPGKYDDNIKKANELWQNDRLKLLQSSYKNTDKITVINEPTAISNKDNKATVRVKIKKTDKDNRETSMTVTYNLVADKNGNWKIKNNVIEK